MKIQCSCGAKYAFDAPPHAGAGLVRFACPGCGIDLSQQLNQLIREQAGAGAASGTGSAQAVPVAIAIASTTGGDGVALPTALDVPSRESSTRQTQPPSEAQFCLKHPGQPVAAHCLVCRKPICPQCMELFGYLCSVYCQQVAEKTGVELPLYEQQRSVVRARQRKKAQRIAGAVGVGLLALAALWVWYRFFASKPHVVYSAQFPAAVHQGACKLIPPGDALVLRGGRLARYDFRSKREVWSVELPGEPDRESAPFPGWHARENALWLVLPDKLARLDWQTGQVAQEIPLPGRVELFAGGETALLAVARDGLNRQTALRVSLPDGQVQQEEITLSVPAGSGARGNSSASARFPSMPSASLQVARASASASVADADEFGEGPAPAFDSSGSRVVAGGTSLVQLSVKLLEAKAEAVATMKPRPERSALEGPLNAATAGEAISELLNEMQRERTGGVEYEDASRYQVTLKRLFNRDAAEWTGEVVGAPALYPLESVTVLIAGKAVTVFDQTNRKLWETKLAHAVAEGPELSADGVPGEADDAFTPCAERDGALYLFDRGMLTAFELSTGNARWRLPSVGISRVLFDDRGNLYVNTTDAGLDDIKYSQQIDIERRTRRLVLKLDPQSGKILWRARSVGRVASVTGRFVYALEWASGEDHSPFRPGVIPAHLRLYRLNPEDGGALWEHYDRREPLALDFHRNTIAVLFKQEAQVMKFLSF